MSGVLWWRTSRTRRGGYRGLWGKISIDSESEKPDAVVFLSTGTFAHRAMIRYCRAREFLRSTCITACCGAGNGSYELAPRSTLGLFCGG